MNCFQAKAGQVAPQWYVIDATNMVVGRLAAQIAPILMGKHRPTYTAHIDTGDFVIVTNVDKVVFTGNKWQQKSYQRYSGHPGGQKEEQAWKLFQRRPHRILELAITRMMPKNKIGRHMMGKLKLVVGTKHDHQAQNPIPLDGRNGRPAPAGILLAAPMVVNHPKKKLKKHVEVPAPGPTHHAAPEPVVPADEAVSPTGADAPHSHPAEPEAAAPENA
jgi:large subunit ribosomal protein L13